MPSVTGTSASSMTKSRYRAGFATALLCFTVYAITASLGGPSFPDISKTFGLAAAQIGSIPSVYAIGFAASLPGGTLSDYVGKKWTFVLGFIVIICGLMLYSISSSFIFLLAAAFVLGIGAGFFESGMNPYVAELSPEGAVTRLNFLHMFYGVGTFIGPLLVGFLLLESGDWRISFEVAAVIVGVVLVLSILISPSGRPGGKSEGRGFNLQGFAVLKNSRYLLGLALLIFMIWGLEMAILNWLPYLLRIERGYGILVASVSLSLYQIFLTVGRANWGFLGRRVGKNTLRLCVASSALALIPALMNINLTITLVSLAVSSFFAAAVVPTVLALGTNEFAERKGMIAGLLLFCGNLGGIAFPLIVGWVGQFSSLSYGFLALTIAVFLTAFLRL